MDYKTAGVDIEAGRAFVQRIQSLVERTRRPEVLGELGGFSGLCELPSGYRQPVLVSGTDGVGTKLKVAQILHRHDTVGVDLVAMCVNDVLTCGAEPLFFLDYLATGALDPEQLAAVVDGISQGCQQANCALLGGETAEMPGFYAPGDYDLAGFCVGVVEKAAILDGRQMQVGDAVIGLASQGIHSNGYSLVRKIVQAAPRSGSTRQGFGWDERLPELAGQSVGDVLLTPTQIYVRPVLSARQAGLEIHGMAHITGGGLPENLPRCLGANQAIAMTPDSWPVLPVFQWLAQVGPVSAVDMFNTFNMGIGFAVVVSADQTEAAIAHFAKAGVKAYQIGEIVPGNGELLGLPT